MVFVTNKYHLLMIPYNGFHMKWKIISSLYTDNLRDFQKSEKGSLGGQSEEILTITW